MIVIYVRATEDWDNYELSDLLRINANKTGSGFFINKNTAQQIANKISFWDSWMDIPYFKYRSLLKSLAQKSWSNYKVCYTHEQLMDTVKDDDFVCATDDDDWFRWDLLEKIPLHIEDADVLYWDHVVHCTHNFSPHLWYDYHDNMGTNNYCISGKKFRSLNEETQKNLVNDENIVLETCDNLNLKSKKTDDLMSCYLWHIGSVSFMLYSSKGLKNDYKKFLNYKVDREEVKWTLKYFNQLVNIHNNLRKEIKIL
jgi:hypothetical protein